MILSTDTDSPRSLSEPDGNQHPRRIPAARHALQLGECSTPLHGQAHRSSPPHPGLLGSCDRRLLGIGDVAPRRMEPRCRALAGTGHRPDGTHAW